MNDAPAIQEPEMDASKPDEVKEHEVTAPSSHLGVGERSGGGFGKADNNSTLPYRNAEQDRQPNWPEDAITQRNQRTRMDPVVTIDQENRDHPDLIDSDGVTVTEERPKLGGQPNPSGVADNKKDKLRPTTSVGRDAGTPVPTDEATRPIERTAGTPVSDDRMDKESVPETVEEIQP